jgi:dTDP-4-dehydrorhamnose 3,5-epimerase
MEFTRIGPEGLILVKPRIFNDDRGYFYESYNSELFKKAGIPHEFVQDNQSLSAKNVLRGLHFQKPPYSQGKLVRVLSGAVLDVAVDIRKSSPTFGQHIVVELSAANKLMLWIPPGFAHGFLSLEDQTIFLYKCTAPYHKESESGIIWNDPELGIDWNMTDPLVSGKDLELPVFSKMDTGF